MLGGDDFDVVCLFVVVVCYLFLRKFSVALFKQNETHNPQFHIED